MLDAALDRVIEAFAASHNAVAELLDRPPRGCDVIPATGEHIGVVGMKAFLRIASRWKLDDEQAACLLGVRADVIRRAREGVSSIIEPEMLVRISHVLAIFQALHGLLGDLQADEWIHRPNTAALFGGGSALDRMLGGSVEDLRRVREYLEGELYR